MLLSIVAFSAFTSKAQIFVQGTELTTENTGRYMNVCPTQSPFSSNIKLLVDYGQIKKPFYREELTDSNGVPVLFNTAINALNFLDENGWEVHHVFTTNEDNSTVIYLLKRKE